MRNRVLLSLFFGLVGISAHTVKADDLDPFRCADCIQSRIDCRQEARAIGAECYRQAIAFNSRCRADVDRCSNPDSGGSCLYYECRPEVDCPDCCTARRDEEFAQCQAWLDIDSAVCAGVLELELSGCRYSCAQYCGAFDCDPNREGSCP